MSDDNKIAPITLFVYNRPWHTRQTVEALLKNEFAAESDLIIFSDAPKSEGLTEAVRDVRQYIRQIDGFKSVTIVERETNIGLARSIIEGVTEVCNSYGRVIVLEDDIVTSPHFLTFMNMALDRYSNEPRVWHISGWNYPIDPEGLPDAFFWRVMNCWGWATWADRWKHFQKDPQHLIQSWDHKKIKRFNLDGSHDFWSQITANASHHINTWAIFWYATIFERNGLCLNPTRSLVENIGHDGSGENCGVNNLYLPKKTPMHVAEFPMVISESALAIQKVQHFNKSNNFPLKRLLGFVKRVIKKLI
ncbi:MAG: hypothetical protein PF483_10780 [Halothiobacillus sp.]|jgi:hypothetical protein|nr:hypothetical protein [Halothiobacillus sp.]